MADYFSEMSWEPLGEGETPNHLLHLARLLRDFAMFDVLGEDKKLPPPASKDAIEKLPKIKVTETGEQCAICLKHYALEEEITIMPCKHKFHSTSCILPWLAKTNSCPVCRHELPTDDESYEMFKKEKLREKQRESDIENLHNSMFS